MEAITHLSAQLGAAAAARGHRAVLVLAGSADWCRRAALAALPLPAPLWIGSEAPAGITPTSAKAAHAHLGRDTDALVVDAHDGFDVDAFGAVAGTVRAGGLLLLLTPPLPQWSAFPDPEHARIGVYPEGAAGVSGRFLARLARLTGCAEGIAVVGEGGALPALPPVAPPPSREPAEPPCRSADQAAAVAALERVVHGHRRRPLVLVSDRGRGKSAALGIAAARLLAGGCGPILVSAPRLDAVATLFEHAARLLPAATVRRGELCLDGRRLAFVPPDELVRAAPPAALLLVDEAAAIPAPLLEALLQRYSRIAFATTVHGYEGTGRGFAVRFYRTLDRLTPGWRELRMTTPIRWADGDPLERYVFRALLLDAAPAPDDALTDAAAEPHIERLERDALAGDEATLGELFGLLVSAHYRTRPLDLRHLLDGPNLSVWVARRAGHVAAVLLAAQEGGFDPALAQRVADGSTRPHGHLLPEALAAHLGLVAAARGRCVRVMRIAVHPAVQGRGIGTALLRAVVADAAARGLDYAGSSFGATPELIRFWRRNGFAPRRVSIKRGAASGAHSVLVLRPLSAAGEALAGVAAERFRRHFPPMLANPLRGLEAALVAEVLHEAGAAPRLSPDDWRDVAAFAYGRRAFEDVLGGLHPLALAALRAGGDGLAAQALTLLVCRVLQANEWSESARRAGLSGRAAAQAALRRAYRPLLERWAPPAVRAEAQRLAAVWSESASGPAPDS